MIAKVLSSMPISVPVFYYPDPGSNYCYRITDIHYLSRLEYVAQTLEYLMLTLNQYL